MFRSPIEEAEKAWFYYEPLTLLYPYKSLQNRIIDAYYPYQQIIEIYSEKIKHKIYPITKEYLEKHEISEQNVALLKNAMELWRGSSRTSDAVAPMLYHYSWHCFSSFFVYTFFRWEPEHSQSHGIRISKWSDNIEEIEIQLSKKGLFQRLIDTWTLLGTSTAFSCYLPTFKDDNVEFILNDRNLIKNSNHLSLKQLLAFNSVDFERSLYSDLREELINCPFLINSVSLPTDALKNYLIIFIASSLARYRPILWNSVLIGENIEQSMCALHLRKALINYTAGIPNTTGLLYQISRLLTDITNGKFKFRKI